MSAADLRILSAFNGIDPNGMKWRGSWGIVGIYERNDVVLGSNNESYICVSPSGSVAEDPTTNPAIWELLSSGTATAVSVSTSNGSGITVAEPTPNNFTVATNLVAGSGIGFTPSGVNTSLTIANTGVLSVGAGTGISIGGTAQAPTVANTGVLGVTSSSAAITVGGTAQNPILTQALPDLAPGFTPIDVIANSGAGSITVPYPAAGPPAGAPMVAFPVVAGGRYLLTGSLSVSSNNLGSVPPPLYSSSSIFLAPTTGPAQPPTGGFSNILLQAPFNQAPNSASVGITFTVPAGQTFYGLFVQGVNMAGPDIVTGTISSLYVTRLA